MIWKGCQAEVPPVGSVDSSRKLLSFTATHKEVLGQDIWVMFRLSGRVAACQALAPPVGLVDVHRSSLGSLTRHKVVEGHVTALS